MKRPRGLFREHAKVKPSERSQAKSSQEARVALTAPIASVAHSLVELDRPTVLHTASVPRSAHHPSAETEIRALRAASNHAIATADLLAISATLAHNFIVIIGDGTQLSRAAYLEAFAAIFKQTAPIRYERTADTLQISSSQSLAAEHGHWAGTLPDGTIACSGTYMAMWRQVNARWQLRSELFVTLG